MTKQNIRKKSSNVMPLILVVGFLLQGCGKAAQNSTTSNSDASTADQMCMIPTDEPSYFEEVQGATSIPENDGVPPRRFRNVKANVLALQKSLLSGRRTLRLDLFEDKAVTVAIEKVQKVSSQNLVMTGHILGQDLSAVTLVIDKGVVIANVHPSQGSRYSIEYQADGTHSIQEREDGDSEQCEAVEAPQVNEDDQTEDSMATAANKTIDMLVAYTPGARAKAGGTAAIQATIQMGIADTNKAFANSGVGLSVRLAGTMEVRQNDTNNFNADLNSLTSKTDGRWDEVHAERARLGADQVTMVGTFTGNGVAGIGWIKSTSSTAFSVVKISAFNIYSFTHELGHNIGLQHSDGYVNSGHFRTIMAYGSVPRILRFSSPSLAYNGLRTGDSSHNSSSKLNLYGGKTAALFASKLTAASLPVETATDVKLEPMSCAAESSK
jgi:hypothetical protein